MTFDAIIALLPPSLPHLDAVSLNGRVLVASIGLTLLGGLCAGFVSAIQASSASIRGGMAANDRGHTRSSQTVRRILVVSELALGVLLLVGALLMTQTFLTLRPSDPGFDPGGRHIALVQLPTEMTLNDRHSFVQHVSDELLAVPGIRAVATTTTVPMRRSVAVLPAAIGGATHNIYTGIVSTNYFDLMDIGIRRGRGFTAADRQGSAPVAVVNETFARRWFPDIDPLGATFTVHPGTSRATTLTIVGVAADIRSFGGDTRIRPFAFTPAAQSEFSSAFFVVHADVRAATSLAQTIREIVGRLRPGLLVDEVEALIDEMNAEVAQPRLGAWLFTVFAVLAVLLGAVGLAATLAWSVAQRRREIAIRMALGAQSADVRGLVLRQTLWLSIAGVAVGLLTAAASTRLLEGWLYGVTPLDPWTFAACGISMLGVAALAAYVPTRRATRISPIIALRGD